MPAKEFQCRVERFEMLTPTVFQLAFSTPQPAGFEAGQFISIIVPGAGPNGRDLRRAYSIASGPQKDPIELCIKLVEGGPGTNYLYKMRPGSTFKGFAPYGDFTYEPKTGRDAVFLATGTGIAPYRAFIESGAYLAAPPRKAWCLLGVRTEDELLYGEQFRGVFGDRFIEAVSQPRDPAWQGFKGRITDVLRSWKDEGSFAWAETDFYLCGNGAMITETLALLTEMGVQKDAIHKEKYY